uniref:Putative HAT dimerization domain, Ribonuclease H-like domain protein n=2 Tax=Helianthus annuus TaxID=4232 RepID=A0A251UPJ4_HELAN
MDNMVGEIKDVMKDNKYAGYFEEINQIVLARWDKMSIPLHCLGHALNPRFYDKHYLQQLAPNNVKRKAPNLDVEVANGVIEAFKKIREDEEEQSMLRAQFATFHMKKGIFSRTAAQADAVTMDAVDWWGTYGSETPELAEVAKKVLSQPISSSLAERNWSTYSYIHNVKRNRLNCDRADKLVFIHSNIRLQSRFLESYKSGPHKKWDMNLESTYIEGSSAHLEEMVWENLVEEDVDNRKGKRARLN